MRTLAHVVLGFFRGPKGTGRRYGMNARVEVDVPFPYPGVSRRVQRDYRSVALPAVEFLNLKNFLLI